jgi:hypothetical protein
MQLEQHQEQAPPALTSVFDLVAAILAHDRKNTLAGIATMVSIAAMMSRRMPSTEDREWLAQQFFEQAHAVASGFH